jgi:L-ascorbate metabolism protein UlaG (beta-lactamase superfamily)
MSIENIGKIDAIIISHEFSDHCHEETLLLFDDNIPILATKSAINRLKKNIRRRFEKSPKKTRIT